MKRSYICLICVLVVMAVVLPVMAASTVSVSLSADSTSVQRGSQITVSVSATVDSCKRGGIALSYDSSVFELVSGQWKLNGAFMSDFDVSTEDGVFAFTNATPLSGTVFEFVLKVKDTAAFAESKVSAELTADGVKSSGSVTVSVKCAHSYDNACDGDCNICGASRTVSHSYDGGRITTAATCTAEGVKTYTCTVCGATKTEKVAKIEHSYDGGKITTAATCTAEGVKTYTCTGCGATKTEKVAKIEHSYDGGRITTEATCAAEGVKTYTCTGCGTTRTESIAATEHAYDSDCDTECDKCGAVRDASHKWRTSWSSDASGHYHVCSTCGEKKDTAEHTPGDAATEWNDQKCTVCGYVIQSALGHTHKYSDEYTYDETGHWYECSGCQSKEVKEHSFDNECDSTCDACGYTRDSLHNYAVRWSSDETGHWHECMECGEKLEVYVHVPGPEATEESDQICTECGYVIQAAANHEHTPVGDWLSNAQNHWQQCACGVDLNEEEHTWGEGVKGDEPGVTVFYCTECGYPMYCNDEVGPDPSEGTTPDPTESAPQETQPQGGGSVPGDDDNQGFPWWIVIVIVCVLLLGGIVFVIIGIVVSKKQTGKYTD